MLRPLRRSQERPPLRADASPAERLVHVESLIQRVQTKITAAVRRKEDDARRVAWRMQHDPASERRLNPVYEEQLTALQAQLQTLQDLRTRIVRTLS